MEQPEIIGYRQLTNEDAKMINGIKAAGLIIEGVVERLRNDENVDQRWVSIGETDLQTGLMALIRAIAKPESF